MSAGPYSIGSDVWPGLSKLIEEMGEAGQVAGKLIATGGETAHWDGTDLRQRLSEETADVAAAIDFVTAINGLDTPEWRERRRKKAAQFRKWHHEQGGAAALCEAEIAPPPHGRCGVVALVTDPAGRLLLIRSKKPGRGWELPGGKINGAELWREALCREVREETGLDVALSEEPPRVLDGKRVPGAFTNVVLFAKGRADGEPTAGDDAAEARWFTADEVPLDDLSEFASTDDIRYWVDVQREIAARKRTPAATIAAMWADLGPDERTRQIEAAREQVAKEKALREPPTATVESGSVARTEWTPTVGARVVTAARLDPVRSARFGPRLPRSFGTVKGPADDIGEALYVTHDSGEIHAYLADELSPAPEVSK